MEGPAGWYPDPDDASSLRYWDGSNWTTNSMLMPDAPTPAIPDPTAEREEAVSASGPRLRNRWALVVGAVIVVAVIIGAATQPARDRRKEEERAQAAAQLAELLAPVEVLYEVEGTARSVSLTLEAPSGTQQGSNKAVPLKTDSGNGIRMEFERGAFVYISAQNEGESGTVTCRITVDGEVISENTSSGAYTIASCDGSA